MVGCERANVADASHQRVSSHGSVQSRTGLTSACGGHADDMSMSDDDISSEPTEAGEDKDKGGHGSQDTGDLPTERDDDLDQGGEGDRDTGDEA